MSDSPKPIRLVCSVCGGYRQHRILFIHSVPDRNVFWPRGREHSLCQCMGCEAVCYHAYTYDADELDGDGQIAPFNTCTYPTTELTHRQPIDEVNFPPVVQQIYRETIGAFNAGLKILVGGGLRAIVEAICKDLSVSGRNLEDKIDALVERGYLARAQADLLHEERYLGNASLHELRPPRIRDLVHGFGIIEGMLNAIYVLPRMAEALRAGRTSTSEETA